MPNGQALFAQHNAGHLRSHKSSGLAASPFEDHFSSVYGSRWPALFSGLKAKPRKVALLNPFSISEACTNQSLAHIAAELGMGCKLGTFPIAVRDPPESDNYLCASRFDE